MEIILFENISKPLSNIPNSSFEVPTDVASKSPGSSGSVLGDSGSNPGELGNSPLYILWMGSLASFVRRIEYSCCEERPVAKWDDA